MSPTEFIVAFIFVLVIALALTLPYEDGDP